MVRPPTVTGRLGLFLPPVADAIIPAQMGTTNSTNTGSTQGMTHALVDLCHGAEHEGASALWAVDHLFWPAPMLECMTTLAVAATATSSAAIGTAVLQLPLRRASAVAKQATTLQLLSGGRFVLGIGVGSHAGEYEMAGADFGGRGKVMDRQLSAIRQAWAGGRTPGSPYGQRPASAPVPVWVGGSSDRALRRAAGSGDGWIPMFIPPPVFGARLSDLRDALAAATRPAAAVVPAVVAMMSVGPEQQAAEQGCRWLSSLYSLPPKAFVRHLTAGSAARCAEVVQDFYAAGAEHVAVMITDDRPLDQFAALTGALAGSARREPSGIQPPPILAGAAS